MLIAEGMSRSTINWLPYQELNPSATNPFRWVVVKSTSEPIVVNLSDDFWDRQGHNPEQQRLCG
jgi:hypothetical protein